MSRCVAMMALWAILASPVSATTYFVTPDGTGDYPTIQAAIDAVVDGDIIELTDGTFTGDGNRDVDYLGKAITIRSQTGDPADCTIDRMGSSQEPHRAFHFHSGEQSGSVLSGVTITNGWAHDDARGGCIRCENASAPVITNCLFTHTRGAAALCISQSHLQLEDCVFMFNDAYEGGGVCCEEATLTLMGCGFYENTADFLGGAVHAHAAVVELLDCEFADNSSTHGGAADFHIGSVIAVSNCRFYQNSAGEAGCLCLFAMCQGLVENCTFARNSCQSWASALSVGKSSTCEVSGCTFYRNRGGAGALSLTDNEFPVSNTLIAFNEEGPGIYQYSQVTLTCCDIVGNQGGDWIGMFAGQYGINGNIAEDPLFCDPGNGDFTVACTSPCAPFTLPNPECDLIGAWPVGCGDTPVTESTWGGIKAMFGR